jgi:hypothetical protein
MGSHEETSRWEEHTHERTVHSHPHYHVTHNYNKTTGGFDHLTAEHEHEHDHAEIRHTHFPHENFDKEHAGEAHVHDHEVPVKPNGGRKSTRAKQLT